jgi:hypothetical protein
MGDRIVESGDGRHAEQAGGDGLARPIKRDIIEPGSFVEDRVLDN